MWAVLAAYRSLTEGVLGQVLPYDASCEDILVNKASWALLRKNALATKHLWRVSWFSAREPFANKVFISFFEWPLLVVRT